MSIFKSSKKDKKENLEDSFPFEVKKEDFSNNTEQDRDIILISNNYEIGFPIDTIYQYMNRDYEQIGFSDAVKNQNPSFIDIKQGYILNGFKRLCDQVKLKYFNDLRELGANIDMYKEQGLLSTCAHLEAKRETYKEHVNVIEKIRKSVEENNPDVLSMIESYKIGFLKGMDDMAKTFINK